MMRPVPEKIARHAADRAGALRRAVLLAGAFVLTQTVACIGEEHGRGSYQCQQGGEDPSCSGLPNFLTFCSDSTAEANAKCQENCDYGCTCEAQFNGPGSCGESMGQSSDYLVSRRTDLKVELNATLSFMVFFQDGELVAETDVQGALYFDLDACPGASCSLQVQGIELTPAAPFSMSIEGNTISNQLIMSVTHPSAALSSSFFELPPGSTDLVSAYTRDGESRVAAFTNAVPYGALLDVAAGTFETNLTLNNNSGGQALVFLTGTIAGHPPTADAGPDLNACASTTLDGTASTDPDGDIVAWNWDEAATPLGSGQTLALSLPEGAHTVRLTVRDARGATDTDEVGVTIGDTTPPTLTGNPATSIPVCTPEPQAVNLPLPSVVDDCDATPPAASGQIIAVHGHTLATSIAVSASGKVTLPVGSAVVRWRAEDAHGNVATLDQTINVQHLVTTGCCAAGQTVLLGNDSANVIAPLLSRSYCVLSGAGNDTVSMPVLGAGNDALFGQAGQNVLLGQAGNDMIVGGGGTDVIRGGQFGSLQAFGGAGADQLFAGLSAASTLYGGDGDDLLSGGLGDDVLIPGGGSDLVLASAGNDTVIIRHECEIEFPEAVFDGGPGNDTFVAPVPKATLAALGVVVVGFENYVIDSSQRPLASCF